MQLHQCKLYEILAGKLLLLSTIILSLFWTVIWHCSFCWLLWSRQKLTVSKQSVESETLILSLNPFFSCFHYFLLLHFFLFPLSLLFLFLSLFFFFAFIFFFFFFFFFQTPNLQPSTHLCFRFYLFLFLLLSNTQPSAFNSSLCLIRITSLVF